MDFRTVAFSLSLLAATAAAQGQDPDKPQPQPADVVKELTAEKERLLREIAYAKERAKNGKALLAGRFVPATQGIKAIDAGRSATMAPPMPMVPPQPRAARIGSKDELANHADDTMLVVNGRAIATAAYESLMQYLAASPAAADEKVRAERALFELIRIEGVASAFEENEAMEKVGDVMTQLDAGKPVGELAKTLGVVPGADPDGKFQASRSSVFGPRFEQVAFSTEAGKRSRPFRNGNGLVILQVDKIEKGATADQDKVSGVALQIPWAEAEVLAKAQMAVNQGQLEIVVRDQKTFDLLPGMFRPQVPGVQMVPVAPGNDADTSGLVRQMEQLQAEIVRLQGQTDDAAKERLKALQAEYDRLKGGVRGGENPPRKTDGAEAPAKKD